MTDDFEDIIDQNEEDSFEELHLLVDKGQSSIRIDQFLVSKFHNVSRNRVQNSIDAGLVLVDGKKVKQSYKISGLENIHVKIPKIIDHFEIIPENIPLDIIYEDDALLVINKKPGMIVHPAAGNFSGTLVNALAYYIKDVPGNSKVKEKERFGLVHRIDKETSGLLVVSKTDFAHTHLSKQFFDHSINREYYALVWGEPNPAAGTISVHVGRDPRFRQRQSVFPDGLQGKSAVTHYEVLESYYYTSLVKCVLETGRTHQIRIHMKHIGNPLFNDEKYDGEKIVKGTIFNKYKQFVLNCYKLVPRFALHARSLGFTHPVTGKKLYFEVEPPEDFMALLEKWRHYTSFRKDLLKEEESVDETN